MKKTGVLSILIIISLFVMIGFVYAGCHPICNPDPPGEPVGDCDPDVHGVFIDGECFYCGLDDGIYPEDFGADCGEEGDPDSPQEILAFWSLDNVSISPIIDDPFEINLFPDGKILYMVVEDTELDPGTLTFDISEIDYPFDPLEDILGSDDNLGQVSGNVNAEGTAIGSYEINESNLGNEVENIYKLKFKVNIEGKDYSSILNINVTYETETEALTCGSYNDPVECNADDNVAKSGKDDYNDPEGSDCWYFYEANCTWNTDTEKCGLIDWPVKYPNNPENCTEAPDTICTYSETILGNCEAGDDFITVKYVPETPSEDCLEETSDPIPCPQELRVAFFGFYGFITSFLIIGLIYFFLIKKKDL